MLCEVIAGSVRHLGVAEAALVERSQAKLKEEGLALRRAHVRFQRVSQAAIWVLVGPKDVQDALARAAAEAMPKNRSFKQPGVFPDESGTFFQCHLDSPPPNKSADSSANETPISWRLLVIKQRLDSLEKLGCCTNGLLGIRFYYVDQPAIVADASQLEQPVQILAVLCI